MLLSQYLDGLRKLQVIVKWEASQYELELYTATGNFMNGLRSCARSLCYLQLMKAST
jgi:hypothetical protein